MNDLKRGKLMLGKSKKTHDKKLKLKMKLKHGSENKVQEHRRSGSGGDVVVGKKLNGKPKKEDVTDIKKLGLTPGNQIRQGMFDGISGFDAKPDKFPKKKKSEPLPEIVKTQVDLFPWPFRREHKGVIKRENWNALIRRIQKSGSAESEAEVDQLNQQLQQVLNERDNIKNKYDELSAFVGKFSRNFQATYEVGK